MRWFFLLLLTSMCLAEPAPLFPQPFQEESWIHWSPSGNLLAVRQDRQVLVHDLRSLESRTHKLGELVYLPEISPDDKTLLIGTYRCHLQAFDVATGRKLWEFQGPTGPEEGSYDARVSPDSRYVRVVSGSHGRNRIDPLVRVFETRTGKLVREWKWNILLGEVHWLADGTIVKADGKVLGAFDVATGQKIAQRQGNQIRLDSQGGFVTFRAPDGQTHRARIVDKTLALADEHVSADPPLASPYGPLRRTDEEPYRVLDAGGAVLWERDVRPSFWTYDGGFVATNEEVDGVDVYDVQGRKRGALKAFLSQSDTWLSWASLPYGGPLTFYDLRSLEPLESLTYATYPQLSPDQSKIALITKQGVSIVDVPATLAAGQIVWWKPARPKD